jgi:hypothetical protein
MKSRYWPFPPRATERVVETFEDGGKKRSEFLLRGARVGVMLWNEDGGPAWGWAERADKKHGLSVEWYDNGTVAFVERYVNGLPHGVARHFDGEGRLLLTTRYVRGTGVDLWCNLDNRTLAEETRLAGGTLHGLKRNWNPDGRTVYREEAYCEGLEHGVFREWNSRGRLARGFPRCFVRGARVDKRTYARLATRDRTLPRYRERDDDPRRTLPREYVGQPVHREHAKAPR